MKATKLLAIAATALGLGFFGNNQAQAAPTFLTPDTNFVSHGDGICFSGKSFSLNLSTSTGSSMVIDNGQGFSPVTGSLVTEGNLLNLTTSQGNVSATLLFETSKNSIPGKDIFAEYKVVSSTMNGVKVGALLGVDGIAYNLKNGCGLVKGDVAPIVPEPATISLLLLGLGSMTAAARRKLS